MMRSPTERSDYRSSVPDCRRVNASAELFSPIFGFLEAGYQAIVPLYDPRVTPARIKPLHP
jgi:hypothetical protein